ncbi:hypothetical protein WJX81_008126 [Elliptochloris bilobata]|uniref:Tetratricopeptide repeat protein n=1 Tax=Elliptochloris bilobata TaxID=381761 RepID=A0AAW1R033_9CHLO
MIQRLTSLRRARCCLHRLQLKFLRDSTTLEGAWPNVALAVRLVDALHGATGLPWWATLSLAAVGVRAALLPLMERAPSLHQYLGYQIVQAGTFATFVYAVRRMALSDWPGFATGGALWFPDLRQACRVVYSPDALPPAASAGDAPLLGNIVLYPMGDAGLLLPLAVSAAMALQIHWALPKAAASRVAQARGLSFRTMVKAGLWASMALIVPATLELPCGSLIFWLTSSCIAIGWKVALGHPDIQRRELEAKMQAFVAERSVPKLLEGARALAATGMVPAAMRWLRRVELLDPGNAEAMFAMGMLHAHQQAWPQAEQAFFQAAKLRSEQGEPVEAALCWIGVGQAQQQQQDPEAALQSFERAAALPARGAA